MSSDFHTESVIPKNIKTEKKNNMLQQYKITNKLKKFQYYKIFPTLKL